MTVFFTSDLHLGHHKVADIRGFADAGEHDDALCDNWVTAVTAKDDVWVLGDLAASSPAYALATLATLPGTKHLILGNHDQPFPQNRDAHRKLRKYLDVFDSVALTARRKIADRDVLLSHFPYIRDREQPRYTQWRLPFEGRWLLHGHTHGSERVSYAHPEIHVGLDAWDMRLVPLDTIANIIREDGR